jgi:hypothetical protein
MEKPVKPSFFEEGTMTATENKYLPEDIKTLQLRLTQLRGIRERDGSKPIKLKIRETVKRIESIRRKLTTDFVT